LIRKFSLGGGTGRRTGLKIRGILRFNNIRVLPKSTENIIQTHDWRGFLAVIRSEAGVKLPKIHRRQIGDTYFRPAWREFECAQSFSKSFKVTRVSSRRADFIEPEQREGLEGVERSRKHQLPSLVTKHDRRGELRAHSW